MILARCPNWSLESLDQLLSHTKAIAMEGSRRRSSRACGVLALQGEAEQQGVSRADTGPAEAPRSQILLGEAWVSVSDALWSWSSASLATLTLKPSIEALC